jgi:two-component system, OmpR family, sensor kinase
MTRGAGARFAGRLARPWRSLVRGSLTARLIASLVALVIVTCAVVGVATYTVLRNSLMTNFSQSLQAATQRQISACMNDGDGGGDGGSRPQAHTSADLDYGPGTSPCNGQVIQGQTAGTFGAWDKDGAITEATIVSGQCHVSAADESTLKGIPVQTLPPLPKGGSFTNNPPPAVPTFTRDLPSLGGDYELTAVRQSGGGPVLFTGLPLKNVEGTLRNVEIAEAAVFAIVVLLVAGTGVGLVRLSLRPLRRVAATATMVTELPLDTEVSLPARVPDDDPRTEVGQVGAAFNRMLQHVESALERRAASESRLRRFAADASHELRTPLSSIRGYAELALRHRGPVPEDVTHALHRVESESARMSVLVDELLLLARLDAGRPLEREPVDLTRLTIEATSDARVASPSHRWQLELPDEPLTVRGDEFRLRQVLGNLLSNAAKHTPADSTITVAVAGTAPGGRAPDGRAPDGTGPAGAAPAGMASAGLPAVRLSVTDNGPGIPPELVPELFERFARGDSSRSRTAGSTGLGLAIVKAVVAAHHGSVSVQSHPGQTTFTIVLPAGDQADVQAAGRVTGADGRGGRVTGADGPSAGSAGAVGPAASHTPYRE